MEAVEEADPPADALERLRGCWERIANRAAGHSAMLGASLKDCTLVALEGDRLKVKPRNDLQRETLADPAKKRTAESAIEAEFGSMLSLEAVAEPRAPRREPGEGPDPRRVERLMQDSPSLRKATEMFDAEIVDIQEN